MDDEQIDRSGEEPHFLSVPDVADAFRRMLDEFAHETDRGAVLIAGEIVADTLGSVIETLRPDAFGAKRLKELMRYPGLLASFSARADIAFLAGFIDDNAHGAIGKLRKLRNQAAHSQATFSLMDHRDILRDMCELGPGTAVGVNRMAGDLLLRSVVQKLMDAGVKIEAEIGSNPITSPTDALEELHKRPEAMKELEGRLPRMELAFGVWLLLGLIRHKQRAMLGERVRNADD